jgi:hypothetical protein
MARNQMVTLGRAPKYHEGKVEAMFRVTSRDAPL